MTHPRIHPTISMACTLILLPPAMAWGLATDPPAETQSEQAPTPTAQANPQPSPADPKTTPQASTGKTPTSAPAQTEPKPPKVIDVYPALGDEQIDPIIDIRVRFDQPMDPRATDLAWDQGFFRPRGNWRYDATRYEFTFPFELKPHELQQIAINPSLENNPARGFKSAAGQMAEPFFWTFHTRRDFDDKQAPVPEVIEISPPSGTQVGRLLKIGIVFDQPMAPNHFHQLIAEEDGKDPVSIPYYHIRYFDEENRFEIPIELPPNWSGLLKFTGFRSESNRHASTFQAQYTAAREPLTQSHKDQLGKASQSQDLMILLQDVAQARRGLVTFSERTHTTQYAIGKNGIYTTMRSAGAHFVMDGPNKFYANVTDMAEHPFIIGSDGTTCWWYTQDDMGKQLAQLPLMHLDHLNLVLSDPFGLTRVPAGHAIALMNLEYLGIEKFEGKDCFVVQAWNLNEESPGAHPNITRWWIDANRYLVLQSMREWGTALRVVHNFTYESINGPIDDTLFEVPHSYDIRIRPLQSLGEGYNRRYINLGDPSPGVMSVEWGRYGSAGQKGTGIR